MRNANTKMQGLTLQRPSPKKAEMAPKSQNEGKFDQKENESTSTLIEKLHKSFMNIKII